MTNKAFYAYVKARRTAADASNAQCTAAQAIYDFCRECGVSKAGVAAFIEAQCYQLGLNRQLSKQEKRTLLDAYHEVEAVFASPAAPYDRQQSLAQPLVSFDGVNR